MGVSWYSQAEVVTTEPETVKELILQIADEEKTVPICNLEIKGNSIFFDSDGYGCFGVEHKNHYDSLLFERLFEEYKGALICFEAVSPCQQQRYFFTSTWIKPEGVVNWDEDYMDDWDDEEDEEDEEDENNEDEDEDGKTKTFYKTSRVLWIEGDGSNPPYEGNFNNADIWWITFDYLEKNQEDMPNLYAAYIKAKAKRFDNWIIPWNREQGISYEIAQEIGELYSDVVDVILEECLENMRKWNSYPIDADCADIEFELPKNFPKLSSL
jgi:hypothetical protein